jgi:ribosome-binding protein aMBF1 (putative translation factor)
MKIRFLRVGFSTLLKALRDLSEETSSSNKSHPALAKAQQEALQSQYEELQEELREYRELKSGKRKLIKISSFENFAIALIQARIARGLTQKELAQKLGLKEQQIQRYEASNYASASLARLNQIVDVLNVKIGSRVDLSEARVSA